MPAAAAEAAAAVRLQLPAVAAGQPLQLVVTAPDVGYPLDRFAWEQRCEVALFLSVPIVPSLMVPNEEDGEQLPQLLQAHFL